MLIGQDRPLTCMSGPFIRAATAAVMALFFLQALGTTFEPVMAERAARAAPAGEPPVVNITSPVDGAEVNGTVEITGLFSDPDSSVESVQVRIDDGQWLGAHMAAAAALWNISWDTSSVQDGLHTIFARASDGAQYSSLAAISVIVHNQIPAPPPAKVSVAAANVTASSVVITWNPSTATGFSNYTIQKSADNATWTDVGSLFDQNATVYIAGNLTPRSTIHFRVETSVNGGANSISDPIAVTIPDYQEPQDPRPSVMSIDPIGYSIYPGNKTFLLTAFDIYGYITAYNISWGDGNITGWTPLEHGPEYLMATEIVHHTYSATNPPSNLYSGLAFVKDDAGGIGYRPFFVFVDPQPPPEDGHMFLSAENLTQGQAVLLGLD